MQSCPKCQADLTNLNSSTCLYCGAELPSRSDSSHSAQDSKSEYIGSQNISLPDDDDLGIETNADYLQSEKSQSLEDKSSDEYRPIGDSSPPPPSAEENTKAHFPEKFGKQEEPENNNVKKLSDEEVQEIEKNLYRKDSFINNQEKSALIEKLNSVEEQQLFANTPIIPPKKDDHKAEQEESSTVSDLSQETSSDLPKPTLAKKGQGIAYFYKSFIQISGSQQLYPDETILVKNREYILKPKKLNLPITIGAVSVLAILLLVITGSLLIGNSGIGEGQVIGMVLDEFDRPYIEGATVRFTELDKSTRTNSQGFFILDNIPAGTHQVEYLINDEVVNNDFTTIADSKNSLLVLKPSLEEIVQTPDPTTTTASTDIVIPKPKKEEPEVEVKPDPPKKKKTYATTKKSKKKKATPTKKKSGYGKVVLASSVDGAKFKVDGNVLGAGNLTYSKIKAGSHSYTVSLDGYESYSGKFNLDSDETITLKPNLKKLSVAKKKESYKSDDYFYSANTALSNGDYKTAIADFSNVINDHPSSVDAYYGRARAYQSLKDWENAYSDYVRAAEIYTFKKEFNDAVTCYNRAIEVNDRNVTAFLGRGNLYLNNNEARAAIMDFDKVIKLDKRNFAGYFGMGEASFNLQRYNKAIDYFKDARSINNENPLLYQYLTLSYMFQNDKKNVKKSYKKFIEYATDNEKAKFKRDSKYGTVINIVENQ